MLINHIAEWKHQGEMVYRCGCLETFCNVTLISAAGVLGFYRETVPRPQEWVSNFHSWSGKIFRVNLPSPSSLRIANLHINQSDSRDSAKWEISVRNRESG